MAGRTLTAADAGRHAEEIAAQGYTILEEAIDADVVDRLVADLDRLHAELDVEPAGNGFERRLAHG